MKKYLTKIFYFSFLFLFSCTPKIQDSKKEVTTTQKSPSIVVKKDKANEARLAAKKKIADAKKSVEDAEKACTSGDAKKCIEAALLYENRPESDLVSAVRAYKKGCVLKNNHACGSLGMMRFYGHGIQAEPKKGMQEMEKSCEQNYGQACANLGIIYALGRTGKIDRKKGETYFKKGCELKSQTACAALKEFAIADDFKKTVR